MREELLEARTKYETSTARQFISYTTASTSRSETLQRRDREIGLLVLTPAFEGDLLEVRKQHIENLRNFDGAIIFKGKVNDQW